MLQIEQVGVLRGRDHRPGRIHQTGSCTGGADAAADVPGAGAVAIVAVAVVAVVVVAVAVVAVAVMGVGENGEDPAATKRAGGQDAEPVPGVAAPKIHHGEVSEGIGAWARG